MFNSYKKRFEFNIAGIKCPLLLVLMMGLGGQLFAQNQIYFDHIDTGDGLSQSDVNAIYQDAQGFMWFGTHDGLNKYDGYGFTVYKPDANTPGSITSNLIYDIIGDDSGNLWIGTTGNGINYFDRSTETFTPFKNEIGNEASLSNDHVTAVYLDKKDRLWVGTNRGLNMMDLRKPKNERAFQRFNPEHDSSMNGWDGNFIYTIYEDSKNQIWVGGHRGIYQLSRDENGDIYFRLANKSLGIPTVNVRCIKEDSFGRFILGTESGLFGQTIVDGNLRMQKIDDHSFYDFKMDANHAIWAGTDDGLLYFENTDATRPPKLMGSYAYDSRNPQSLSKNIVKSVFIDKTGIVWAGTNGGGVNSFDPERKQFRHVKKTLDANSLSYDKIRSMYEDSNGTLWIGTEGGGLNMLPKKEDTGDYANFEHFQTIPKVFAITEIHDKSDKRLLVGGENFPGLFQLDISRPEDIKESVIMPMDEIDHSVFALLEDSQKTLWIGTYGAGIHRWMPKEGTFEYRKNHFPYNPAVSGGIASNIIRDIFEDKKGNIWFATGDGLCMLSAREKYKAKPVFRVFKSVHGNPNTISYNYILSIYESAAGILWVGTFGGGLNKFMPSDDDRPERFISYSENDGLPNNVIKGILEDDGGNLWLSTNKGLSRFNPEKGTFKNYDINDGLQSNEFQELACLKRKDGEMLFGGINGFNAFYPNRISVNVHEPETVLTDFSISNRPVPVHKEINGRIILEKALSDTDEIKLKYSENSFSFEFAALHYAAPGKNQFAYTLEGFDSDWIRTTPVKRFATYTNLEPGSYTLKVKASNNDGLWDATPSEIRIDVIPPFWLTGWAYAIYSLCVIALLWLFWRYTFIRTSEKHQLELEHLENEKSEEMQRIKLEFFTNISHEFRTPLTLLKGPLEYLQKNGKTLDQEVVDEQYTLMHKNTNYLLRLVNQLLDFRKINQGKMRLVVRHGDIVAFIRELAEPFQFLAHKKKINFKIDTSKTGLISWFDHDALEKIINNLLSNAFKFTPEGGTIEVRISDGKKERGPVGAEQGKPLGEYVEIRVKDSGSGIPKNKLQSIFERFYTEKDENKANREGVGIGLSFTKDLVALHQGEITVKSKAEKGTKFIVRLPMAKAAYLNLESVTCKEESDNDFLVRSSEAESFAIGINDEIVDESLSNTRSKLPVLLIVDDNPDIRIFIQRALDQEFTVLTAENGQIGLEIALKTVPNIIISDVIMPVMDGMKFCEQLKSGKETSHIPVIMLTAKSSDESMMEGLNIGADDYLTKPFSMELLRVKLANIVSQRNEMRKRFNRKIILEPSEVTVTSTDEKFLKQAIEIVEKHMMNTDFNVELLVKEMGLSRSNLYLKFKEITGLSSSEFIRNIRLKRAVQLFDSSDLSVKEIMYRTGFNTASYFSKCFKKQFGVIPSQYVNQMKKKNIKTITGT